MTNNQPKEISIESHVQSALFLYAPAAEELIDQVAQNQFGTKITPVLLQEFLDNPQQYLQQCDHAIVAGPLLAIKSILTLAIQHVFSIGIIPLPGQKDLRNCYGLPKQTNAALEIALQNDAQVMDIILCNKKILLFKATIGRLPLLDSSDNINLPTAIVSAMHRCIGLKLLPFQFRTGNEGKIIKTAASGSMIIQRHERTLASKLITHDSSLTDGMISMVITAPISIIDYFSFIFQTFCLRRKRREIPRTIGYIKSPQITIETEEPLDVSLDGEKATQTPLHCETLVRAVRINVGRVLRESKKRSQHMKGWRLKIYRLARRSPRPATNRFRFSLMPLKNALGIYSPHCARKQR